MLWAKEQLNVKSKIKIKKGLQIVYCMEKYCAYIQITLYKDFCVHSHALFEFWNISWFLGLIKIIWHEYIYMFWDQKVNIKSPILIQGWKNFCCNNETNPYKKIMTIKFENGNDDDASNM